MESITAVGPPEKFRFDAANQIESAAAGTVVATVMAGERSRSGAGGGDGYFGRNRLAAELGAQRAVARKPIEGSWTVGPRLAFLHL